MTILVLLLLIFIVSIMIFNQRQNTDKFDQLFSLCSEIDTDLNQIEDWKDNTDGTLGELEDRIRELQNESSVVDDLESRITELESAD